MKKKLIVLLVCVLALVAIAVPVYAAISDQQKAEIDALYKQSADIQKQIVDKYAEAGVITKAQADTSKANIDAAEQYRQQQSQNGSTVPGYSTPGYGPGFGGSYSPGWYGGFGGGCWGWPNNYGQTRWSY